MQVNVKSSAYYEIEDKGVFEEKMKNQSGG